MASKVKALVDGGKASAGPPLGPALGPLGVNVGQVVAKINQETASFTGMKVPVTVIVDPKTKSFDVEVGSPPVSTLVKKELGLDKGAKTSGTEVVGDLSLPHVVKIAQVKRAGSLAKDLKGAVKEVLGTCVSSGITVDGKDARELQKEIDEGRHDGALNRWETEEVKPEELPELKPVERKPEKPPEEEKPEEKPEEPPEEKPEEEGKKPKGRKPRRGEKTPAEEKPEKKGKEKAGKPGRGKPDEKKEEKSPAEKPGKEKPGEKKPKKGGKK